MNLKKEIIYPFFIEASEYAKTKFWENIFEELAYGNTPFGTYISKDFLCCKYKNKNFSYKIERKEPQILFEEIKNLLINKLGLISPNEKNKKKKKFLEIQNKMTISYENWKDIKKKSIRELLLELYVTKMKKKYSLSVKQAKYLFSIILIAIIFKVITDTDIHYKNGEIQKISGIDFFNKKIVIEKDLYNIKIKFSHLIVMDCKLMSDSWEKYLKELKKNNIII